MSKLCAPKAFVVYGWLAVAIGFTLFFIAALVPAYVDSELAKGIKEATMITPEAQAANRDVWRAWVNSRDTEGDPTRVSVYMLNLTNPTEVLAGAKPRFAEVGPYVYEKRKERFDVEFTVHDDGAHIVRARDWTYRVFDRALTPAVLSEDDVFTTQNAVFQIWRAVTAKYPALFGKSFVDLWNDTNTLGDAMDDAKRMFSTRPVREILWGFEDARYAALKHSAFPGLMGPNATERDPSGEFTAYYTGADVPAFAHQLQQYEGLPYVMVPTLIDPSKYESVWTTQAASRVYGTDGTRFAPGVTKDSVLHTYVSEPHRTVPLTCRDGDCAVEHEGLSLLRFTIPPATLQNSTQNPANAQWLMNGPSGMFNLQPFTVAPMVLSKPHFLDVTPAVLAKTEGLAPSRELHDTTLDVEPLSGVVLRARKALQVSVNTIGPMTITSLPDKPTWFAGIISDLYVPTAWIQEWGSITPKQAATFRDTVYGAQAVKRYARGVGLAFAAVLVMLGAALLTVAFAKKPSYSASPLLDINSN